MDLAKVGARVERVDPAALSDADLAGWLAVRNAVLTRAPISDAPWVIDGLRGYLAVTPAAEPQVHHLARVGDRVVGYAQTGLQLHENRGTAWSDIAVHPDSRRRGIGRALLREVCRVCVADGRRSLLMEVAEEDGMRFADAMGAPCAFRDQRSVLPLAALDRGELEAVVGSPPTGYHLLTWSGTTPAQLRERFAHAHRGMTDTPLGDLDWTVIEPTPERQADLEDWQRRRGVRTYAAVAIEEATDEIVGYTEVEVAPWSPFRAEQQDTAVVPAHRGRGLARLVKAANLLALLDHEPALREVETENGDMNEAMLAVNTRLGFVPDLVSEERQADVATLATLLLTSPSR